jgi:hypothetical protein
VSSKLTDGANGEVDLKFKTPVLVRNIDFVKSALM